MQSDIYREELQALLLKLYSCQENSRLHPSDGPSLSGDHTTEPAFVTNYKLERGNLAE